ncbi:MAG: Asp-tRNA(Asn)/Glu-tRNA(Gln) amidotransferase GatCAB subunit B [Verrucomicrobiaceae bacterium]|nr:Asp-tRNA(Asn)/Glu-tRNA(Gln) amidotransferase GatCAB subunit B [Verrucomicrobiaceae bacterium]
MPEQYIATIGLEVHCQIRTRSKMFCACRTSFGEEPNTNVCPTCLGLPGSLPVLNKAAIEQTVLAGLLLECSTPEISKWDRKNYFYPDMPKNYQISQFDLPLCIGGSVPLYEYNYPKDYQKNIANPGKQVGLTRIHLEEDVAKSTHLANASVIDFNRAGTPLMEIVSEPEIETPEEAFAYLKTLQQILIYGGISDADMEKGQLRCDVNVSVRRREEDKLGTKIELKNMNSISAVRRALHHEIERQIGVLDDGGTHAQATWRWNDDAGVTEFMRGKEDAHDYRYFPDPDLLPVRSGAIVDRMRSHVPELPHEKADRFEEDFEVTTYDASVLASDRGLADYFEAAARSSRAPAKKTANWVINTLLKHLNDDNLTPSASPVSPESLAATVDLVETGTVSNNQAKEVFEALWKNPARDPAGIAKELGFEPADTDAIDRLIDEAIASNPDKAEEIQAGNEKLVNWLTGQVMKASQGKANPKQVSDSIRTRLL